MRLIGITPMCLHWRARKKLDSLNSLVSDIKKYSGRDIDYAIDTEKVAVIDFTANRILASCDVTNNLDRAFFMLDSVKSYWYYNFNFENIVHKPNLYSRFINLKQRFYAEKT